MPRVAHGVDAGDHGELREAIDPLGILGRHVVAGRPIVDLAAEVDLVAGGIEQPDLVDAAFARENPLPEIFDLATKRGDRSQSGYDDAPFHEISLTTGPSRCIGSPVRRSESFPRHRREC